MKKIHFDTEKDGFYGAYWKCAAGSDCAMITMLGDDPEDYMARSAVKYLLSLGINVLTMSPAKKDYGHHNYPLERIERAIKWLKKTVQMVSYAPHFISTVVICGMLTMFLNQETGIVNQLLGKLGFETVGFLAEPKYFKSIYVWSDVWQGMGWSAIIYISALAGVDSQMHEAAIIDGANKLQRIWHIDIPGILPTITILLIMRSGSIMSVGFEKVFLMQTSLNLKWSQVISTYVYQVGLVDADFSFSAAVGFFNSIVNFIMIMFVNFISGKVSETSLW